MFLSKTYLQDLRAQYPSNLDRDELRMTRYGLLTALINMTNSQDSILSEDLKQKAKNSEGRKIGIPVYKDGDVTINNARSCVINCDQNETDLLFLVWKTASFDICMTPVQYDVNSITYLQDFNEKIRKRVRGVLKKIESDIDSALETSKNQVYNSSLVKDKYPLVGNALQVAGPENKKMFFNDIDPINFEDDFHNEDVYIVASPALMSDVRYYINQGSGNSENLSWLFNGKHFTFSNSITNDKASTGYFMPAGSMAFLTRVDATARKGMKATDGTEWYEDTIPGIPFPVGIQFKSTCSDQTSLNDGGDKMAHLTATMVEKWQISFDYCIATPYNSDPSKRPGSIRKFEVSNTATTP